MTETLNFSMHPALLWDVISRQAGTRQKAVLEAAMNSVDAGATRCDIGITRSRITISDDGRGFESREQIIRVFGTFGYPHQEGDATYGKFRMGRGQMLAFGRNTWTSNGFEMLVDLKPKMAAKNGDYSLPYTIRQVWPAQPGCQIVIELYDHMLPSELEASVREVSEFLAWLQIPVTVNGKQVNKLPADEKWDVETDDAYIKYAERGDLKVYNLGVLVRKYYSSQFGTGGTVVTKRPVGINFARNDILDTCPVWKKIKAHLRKTSTEKAIRKPRMNDAERQSLVEQLIAGDMTLKQLFEIKLLTDVHGGHHPLSKLEMIPHRYARRIAVAQRNDRIGATAHDRNLAFVLATETLDRFGCSNLPEFLDQLRAIARANNLEPDGAGHRYYNNTDADRLILALERIEAFDRDRWVEVIDDSHLPLGREELNPAERAVLDALQAGVGAICHSLCHIEGSQVARRTVACAISHTDAHWSDNRHIWIERTKLPLITSGVTGAIQLSSMLLHELCHVNASIGVHVHDPDFLESFSKGTMEGALGAGTEAILKAYSREIRAVKGKLPTAFLRMADQHAIAGGDSLMEHDGSTGLPN